MLRRMSDQPQQNANPYRAGAEVNEEILISTTNDIEGYAVERYLGIVRGIVVRSASIGQSFVGAFRSLGGGNIKEWTKVCEEARHDAFRDMLQHAREIGAHAVIGMRYDATEFMQGATEVLAYGTAVTLTRRSR
jgi:uncharacterized protein YbjQ (UPF0145 family)